MVLERLEREAARARQERARADEREGEHMQAAQQVYHQIKTKIKK